MYRINMIAVDNRGGIEKHASGNPLSKCTGCPKPKKPKK